MKTVYQYTLVTPVAVHEFSSLRALKTWALENLGAQPSTFARWFTSPQWDRPFALPRGWHPSKNGRVYEMPLYGRVYGTGRTVAAIAFRRPQEQP